MTEKRQATRIPYHVDVIVSGLDTSHAPTRIMDLSTGGAYIDSRTVLPAGHHAIVSFMLVDRELSPEIEVIYAVPGMGMGVQFIGLSASERELIRALVDTEVSGSA